MSMAEAFDELMDKQVYDCFNETFKGDKEYSNLSKKQAELYNKLEKLIPVDEQEILNELENVMLGRERLVYEILYKKGFKDGLKLKKMLGVD